MLSAMFYPLDLGFHLIHFKRPSRVHAVCRFEEHRPASIQGTVEVLTGSRTEQSPVALHSGPPSRPIHSAVFNEL